MEAGQQIRDFILEKKIGAGGVGEVWRARHQHLDKVVAIKAIYRHLSEDSQFRDRALLEPIAMAKLDHPHIVPVYDFFFLDGISYLVMAYIDGGSLADLLKSRGRLTLREALRISRHILDALNFAHSRGVIHRDVKPSNILVRPDGHAYLVDFGIALVVGKPRVTRFGTNIGTPAYMSPEQIQAHEIDHRTDVYSFGCVLYEMLAGQPPFGGQDDTKAEYEIMSGHLHAQPPSLRQINPEVDEHTEAVIFHALAKNPDERYGGCQELAADLYGSEDFSPEPHPPVTLDDAANGNSVKPAVPTLFSWKKLIIPPFLLVGLALIILKLTPFMNSRPGFPEAMLQKITEGKLVLPQGDSAFDLWKNHVQDTKDQTALPRETEEKILGQLVGRGEAFFKRWQDTFSATGEEWSEIARIYEWLIYLQAEKINGNNDVEIDINKLCVQLNNDDIKRLCAKYSYSMGTIDSLNGNINEASKHYDRSQFYDKSFCISYIAIGDMYVSENKFGNAEKPYERSIDCDQNLCYGYFKLGNLFKRRKQQEKTQEYYAKAIRCSPKNPEFLYTFASVYDQWGQSCNAMNLYKDLFKIMKNDTSAQYSIDDIGNHISRLEKQYSCN